MQLIIDGYLAIEDTVGSPTFTAASLSYAVETNSTFMGEPVTTNITITYLPLATSALIITVPTEYSIGTLSLYSPEATLTFSSTGSVLNLTLTGISSANVTITLQGLTNPIVTTSSSWSLSSFTSSNLLVATASSTQFSAACGATCRSCLNSTYCLSCYNNTLVNILNLLDNSANSCVSSCGVSQFL